MKLFVGAVYRAADLTTGFKVKRFLIKDVNMFPVDVSLCEEISMVLNLVINGQFGPYIFPISTGKS